MIDTGDKTLLIVGDVFVRRADPENAFRHVADVFGRADFLLGNLEGVVADGGTPWQKGDINVWKADGRQIEAIRTGHFHAMGVTNNHILDFGHDGLAKTLANLDDIGVKHAGAGNNLDEAHAPAILERDGVRVALLAYTSVFVKGWEATAERPGLAVVRARTAYEPDYRVGELPGAPPIIRSWVEKPDLERVRADIAAARQAADIVICSFHWGISGGYEKLTEYQVELGHHAVDCGADLVFGHHPHLLQGVEFYRDKPIFYSLGNFTFARHNPDKGQELESLIARCRIEGDRIASVGFYAASSDHDFCPHIRTGSDAEPILALVRKRSKAFGTVFVPDGDGFEVRPS